MGASCDAAISAGCADGQQILGMQPDFQIGCACCRLELAFCPAGDVCKMGQRWPLLRWMLVQVLVDLVGLGHIVQALRRPAPKRAHMQTPRAWHCRLTCLKLQVLELKAELTSSKEGQAALRRVVEGARKEQADAAAKHRALQVQTHELCWRAEHLQMGQAAAQRPGFHPDCCSQQASAAALGLAHKGRAAQDLL